jgi:dCMP deaminase
VIIVDFVELYFELAKTIARKSKDRSTQVGCVLAGPNNDIRAMGYNGFVRGANDKREDWHKRPLKYFVTIHAEVNALLNAARHGVSTDKCSAFITAPPCARCAGELAQAGIHKVHFLVPTAEFNVRWEKENAIACEIFEEADILYAGYDCQSYILVG